MISQNNGNVSITGPDQIVFSIVLFMLDLTLHPKALARTHRFARPGGFLRGSTAITHGETDAAYGCR